MEYYKTILKSMLRSVFEIGEMSTSSKMRMTHVYQINQNREKSRLFLCSGISGQRLKEAVFYRITVVV